jgi:hypothetical protein
MSDFEVCDPNRDPQVSEVTRGRGGAAVANMDGMKLLVLLILAGCITEPVGASNVSDGVHLPSDGHYIALRDGYPTPQACFDQNSTPGKNPFFCRESLSLCANGRVGYLQGDVIYEGTYTMHAARATFAIENYPGLQFDVSAVEMPGVSTTWIVDTEGYYNMLQFDNISCQ